LKNKEERKKWLQIIHSYFKNSGEKIERLLSLEDVNFLKRRPLEGRGGMET